MSAKGTGTPGRRSRPTRARANPQRREFILAIGRVAGATRACAARGDAAMFAQLGEYYALVAGEIAAAGGRVIKVMGDSVLLTFPMKNAREAVAALRALQETATALWRRFDRRCVVQWKVEAGAVMCGRLGAPGAERWDMIGDALNALLKAPWADLVVGPEMSAQLQ